MKQIRLFVLLLMAFFMPLAMQAQETLTVNATGTNTSSTIPIYGLYCDHGNKTQFIVPASLIEGMENGQISQMVFYTGSSDANVTWGNARFNVYLSEVGGTFFANTTFEDWATLTQVYAGELSVSNNQMTVEFDDEFLYSGGNLLVAFEQSVVPGTWDGLSWLGATQTENTALYQYASSTDNVYGSVTASKFMPKVTFTYTEGAASSCAKPATITIGDVTKNSANVTWESEGNLWNLQYKLASDTSWTSVNGLTTASHTLTGLTSNKNYNVRVQNVCDDTTASGWRSATFTTRFAMPFLEKFPTTTFPQGWARYSGLIANVLDGIAPTTTTSGWSVLASSNGVFDTHAKLNIYGTSCNYWMVTPDFLMEDNVQLTFDLALTKSSGTLQAVDPTQQADDKFAVLVHNTDNDTWTELRRWANTTSAVYKYNNISTTGEEVAFDLSSFAGQNIAIAFYGESTVAGGDNNLHIDNVEVNYIPTCAKPKQPTVSDIAARTAIFSWVNENEGTPAGYIVKVTNETTDTTYETTSNPYTIQNLEPHTTYTVSVMTACSTTDSSSWSREITFTTECEIFNVTESTPYQESFDGTTFPPLCWIKEHTAGSSTSSWVRNTTATFIHSGAGSAQLQDQSTGNKNNLVTGQLNIPEANTYQVDFWMYRSNYSTLKPNEGIKVWVNTTPDTIGATEMLYIRRQYTLDPVVPAVGWYEYDAIIPTSGDLYIIFEGISEYGTATYIDDITVLKAPTCIKPRGVAAIDSTITTTSATIAWENMNNEDPMGWIISYNNVETPAATNPFTLTGLTPSTNYTVKVRAACSTTDTSDWSATATFATACDAVATLTEDFESYSSGLPLCWDKVGEGTVAVQTAHVHAGGKSLKFSGVTGGNIVALPEIESYEGMQFRFYTQPESSSSSCGTFAVGYITNIGDATTFHAMETYNNDVTDYVEKIIDLSTVPAGARLAFNHMAASNIYYWFVDDINVELAPIPCAVPENVSVDTNYVVRWETNGAIRYNVMIVVGNDTAITATSTTGIYTITSGLNNGDVCAVYVQAVCAEDDLSAWSEPYYFTYTTGVGVNTYAIAANIYPNPTTGNVTVESNAIGADLSVYDLFGKQLMNTRITAETTELNLSSLAPGVYMVRIANQTGITTVKVVKE